jgi:hypothetical protein
VLQAIKASCAQNNVQKATMAKVAGPSVLAVLMFPVTPTMAVVFVQVVLLERTAHKNVIVDCMVLIVS